VWGQLGRATVYVHPRAFESKFGRWGENDVHDIGSPIRSLDQVRAHVGEVVSTTGPTELAEGVWVSGEIPRGNDFEDTGGPFFLDQSCRKPDPLADDQAMYIETPVGVVVLLGCAHAGLVNTLDYASQVTGLSRIHAVLGGMHLVNASENRINRSVAALRDYDVRVVGPAHCTGLKATAAMLNAFADQFVSLRAGAAMSFPGSV
jgi:7,8-dihydropterin-6-yl-methyl-4-(beta-D-ribofuranosyl)aminobenzene 5'-phosphate synthase